MDILCMSQTPGESVWHLDALSHPDYAEDPRVLQYMSLSKLRYRVQHYDRWPGGTLLYDRTYDPDPALADAWIQRAMTGCRYFQSAAACRAEILEHRGCFNCCKRHSAQT